MITDLIRLLNHVEGDSLAAFARGSEQYPTTFKKLFKWIKRKMKR